MAAKQITQRFFSMFSFLSWGPLSSLTRFFAKKLAIFMIDETVVGAHVLYIYGDVTVDRVRVEKIISKIHKSKGLVNEKELEKLDEELGAAGVELIKLRLK